MTALTPILKPVGSSCNLDCKYCFYKEKHKNLFNLMDLSIIEKFFIQSLEASPQGLKIIWHGGEPLLAGIDFYDKVIQLEKKLFPPNYQVKNLIQTNGTLINQEWIDFFKENCFGIGISLDGPKEIHDKCRLSIDGKPTFDIVLNSIDLLKKNNIKFGVLAVITKNSLDKSKKIFDFFYENEIFDIEMNPCYNYDENGISPLEFSNFIIEIFEHYLEKDDPRVSIRFLNDIISSFFGGNIQVCSMTNQRECGLFPTINWNGDVYFCDNYDDNNEFLLGNILNQDLKLILKNSISLSIIERIKEIQFKLGCFKCEISDNCGGGCSRYWFWRSDYYLQCASRRKIVYYILDKINTIINISSN